MIKIAPRIFLILLLSSPASAWIPSHYSSIVPHPTTTRLHATTAETTEKELLLYNSKSRQKEPFLPQEPPKVSMYTCGPTLYDYAHIGNFRAFLTYDVLKRVLQYFGYEVTHICNLTDVDDKIIVRANEENYKDVTDLTEKFERLFMNDLAALNIQPAKLYPKATEHIDEMIDMVHSLYKADKAYQTPDGSWYFDTAKHEGYGQQLVPLQSLQDQDNSDDLDPDKRNAQDFCLWKAYKPGVDREDTVWDDSKVGKGRPGWHLECSAMARKYLGDTLDVHCGGIDLRFPHHENEIAQSEAVTGQPFCNCWIHNGFVNVGADKMSKSLGNFLTLRAACPEPAQVRAYRYLVVSSHYRNPLSFTTQARNAAQNALKRVDKLRNQLDQVVTDTKDTATTDSNLADTVVPKALGNFELALRDDLSMPRAAASLFSLVKAGEAEFKRVQSEEDTSSSSLDLVGLRAIREALLQMDRVFGIFYTVPGDEEGDNAADLQVPEEVLELVAERTAAKESKDWELADSLRARITELGYQVKDVKGGEPIVTPVE